jgi:hypothetical protein
MRPRNNRKPAMTDTAPDAPADAPEPSPGFDLDDFEVRVLAVLIEKAFVTPDTYPCRSTAWSAAATSSPAASR